MAGQLDAFFHHFDRSGDGAAIRMIEHHDQRHVQELHREFQTGEVVVVKEIASRA